MLKYMLDTNIVIYVIKNRPKKAVNHFNLHAGQMCISVVTYAELWYGVEKSASPKKNTDVLEDFISRLDVLSYSEKAAAHYGEIRADLERRGQVIGANDLFIAAHARCEGLILVTNNGNEFERVGGLRIENWIN